MFFRLIDKLTPRVKPETRLFTAAIAWTTIGFVLTAKGTWISHTETWQMALFSLAIGLALGLLKSKIIFDRAAIKVISHIGSRPQKACLGGLFSPRNWILILTMAVFGKIIGALPIPPALKTACYVMVGSGLGYSSRLLWRAWRNSPADGLQNS